MTRLALLAVLVAGCGRSVDMFPVGVGGTGGTGGNGSGEMPDGATDDSMSGNTISGHVCLLVDPRQPTSCAPSGAKDFTVKLGTNMTVTTTDDGAFTITKPTGTNLVWHVSGTGQDIVPSATPFSADTLIPAMDKNTYDDMLASVGAPSGDGSGAIIAKLTNGGAALSGATATPSPGPEVGAGTLYDGSSVTAWDTNATGQFGVVWVPGMGVQASASLAIVSNAATGTVTGIPLFADTVTFVLAEIP